MRPAMSAPAFRAAPSMRAVHEDQGTILVLGDAPGLTPNQGDKLAGILGCRPQSGVNHRPQRVSETIHSPQSLSGKSIAFAGQNRTHTPQPSHRTGSTEKRGVEEPPPLTFTAANLQRSRHSPHPVQASRRMTASRPLRNSLRSRIRGRSTRSRSAASTSQSAMTGRFARTAKEAARLVLPVRPLPLTMTSFLHAWKFPLMKTNSAPSLTSL